MPAPGESAASVVAWIGLGANLDDPAAHVVAAMSEIEALEGVRPRARSALYRSAPLGYADQPAFINAVIAVETTRAAADLLAALLALEQAHGRRRSFRNAPRTLDLDLLLHGETVLTSEQLTLPHPRMHERAFVLAPLAELAPQLEIPGRGRVGPLFAALPDQGVVRLGVPAVRAD